VDLDVTRRAAVVCDLDGVVWLADDVLPGAPDAIARLRGAGHPVLFVTNNSFSRVGEVEAKLARMGIPATGDVVTSAQAGAALVPVGSRVLLCGGPGAEEALLGRSAVVLRRSSEPVHVVLVGFHRDFDYEEMRLAAQAVRRGALLIATNDDATYPTPDGPIPGCGSIVAGIATAAGVEPLTAGKPYPPMAELIRGRLGERGADVVMIGDRPDTDGRFATVLGARFALVLSGVTAPTDLPVEPSPDLVAADLAAVADHLLAG
jgi:HAD superfamily hydrolase (TIGR01450 family)